ncbi:coiled-coil domain-containing protein 159 [Rhynchocyon petersi]
MGEHEQVVRGSDPLLAGLPRDSDYPGACLCCSALSSNVCLSADEKCDKFWGLLRDKPVDCTLPWSRTSDSEPVEPAASENTGASVDRRPGWGSGPRPHGAHSFLGSDLMKERGNQQDIQKRHHHIAKKSLETNNCKAKAKSTIMIPEAQKQLRLELESLKSQLQAQTKAFEFLNHSVTMLEKESCLQQIKIQQLEEVLNPTSCQTQKELHKRGLEQGRQELYGALAQGLQGLQKTLKDNEEMQQARTTRCLQLLAQEIQDSKKFLWEELELIREEVTFIYQKLQAQEEEITENLMNIKKMQKTQVKCRKVLTKMKQQGYEACMEPEETQGDGGSWKNSVHKELSDIWSAVHLLHNSIDSLSMPAGARLRGFKGYKGHQCLSPPPRSWDSDSESDHNTSKPRLSKNLSA